MNRSLLVLLSLVLFALVGLAAYQTAAAVVRPDAEDQNSMQRIKQLTPLEYERLKIDFETFYSYPPEKQQHLRAMHEALQTGKGQNLRIIAENYYQWYSKLGAPRRSDLRHEDDVTKKRVLVREELDRQANRDQQSFLKGPGRPRFSLSQDELKNVMDVVEVRLQEVIPERAQNTEAYQTEWTKISEMSGIRRYYAVMEQLLESLGFFAQANRKDRRNRESRLQEFFEDDRFVEAISNPRIRRHLSKSNDPDKRPPQRGYSPVLFLIMRSMHREYREEFSRNRPDEPKLIGHFGELSQDQRDQLMELTPKKFIEELEDSYARTHPNQFPPNPWSLFRRVMSRGRQPGDRRERRGGPERRRRAPRERFGDR